MKCTMPDCKQPAEVEWEVNGPPERKQHHHLCGAHMATLWNKITENYKGSNAHEASTFKPVKVRVVKIPKLQEERNFAVCSCGAGFDKDEFELAEKHVTKYSASAHVWKHINVRWREPKEEMWTYNLIRLRHQDQIKFWERKEWEARASNAALWCKVQRLEAELKVIRQEENVNGMNIVSFPIVKDDEGPPKKTNWLKELPVGSVFAANTRSRNLTFYSCYVWAIVFQGEKVTKLKTRDGRWSKEEWVISEIFSDRFDLVEILIQTIELKEATSPKRTFPDDNKYD